MVDPNVLKQVLRESGLKYEETAKSYVFTCPRCAGKRKLWMFKSGKRFVCWKCKETDNYQGRVEFALSDLLAVPVKVVQSRLGITGDAQVEVYLDAHLEDFYGDGEDVDDFALEASIPEVAWPLDYYPIESRQGARGAAYLEGRGVSVALAQEYGIHYAPVEQRVVFPVSDHGRLYGWQGRLIIPHKYIDPDGNEQELLKIKSSTGIPRERTLMFADRLTGSPHAVLTEGPVDAIKAHMCGGNVCAMGKAVNPEQMKLLLRAGAHKVYLGLDPDAAGETTRLVREYFDDVALYELRARVGGAKEKPDLGAMTYRDVYELFRGAERIGPGRLFFFLDPEVAR